ncbi:MAG: flagellar basal body-associated FliL family protein [Nitrospinae bacterium]|jgi:flagellar protein FliL|nr:flagellar basal body-associated FliL family protein [Nitrospinota bacterium]MDA1110142.1 flagellar basal body-associated FliL family protein [Nitrospinota bacterium]
MAEQREDILDEVDIDDQAPAKKSSLKMIFILLVVLSALGGGGYYAYITYFNEQAPAAVASKESAQQEAPNLGVMFPLDPFVVNLAGSEGKRFLKVTVSLELSAPEVHVEVKENLQKITDSILVLLSSKNFEDVYSVQGKFKLKDEITTRVNRFLVLGHIKEAYFTEFIIQ